MTSSNKYWKGIEELEQHPDFVEGSSKEFSDGLPLDKVFSNNDEHRANRRDFLKYFGFSITAVTLAACNKTPVKYAMPYVVQPDNVTPGMPLYYASSSISDNEGFPVLVKVREGRPIKFEPNKEASFYGGGLDGLAHASILSLYDTNRLKGPRLNGEEVSWEESDKAVTEALKSTAASGKRIALVGRNNTSLVLDKAITDFKANYPNTDYIQYEAISYSGMLDANERSYGRRVIPTYHFDKADVIVSFGADFLGTWLSPTRFTSDYGRNRVPKDGKMSKHIQFESLMSLTGANADVRIPMRASKTGLHLIRLYNELAGLAGVGPVSSNGEELAGDAIKHAAHDLWKAKGKALVVCGSNDADEQGLVNAINGLLGSNGSTIDLSHAYNGNNTSEKDTYAFVKAANAGSYGAVIFLEANPVYAGGDVIAKALGKIEYKISTSIIEDETASLCNHLCPNLHALESWDIKQPYSGRYVFNQPTISPVFNGRQQSDSLLAWSGASLAVEGDLTHAYSYTKAVFADRLGGDFNATIEKGFMDVATEVNPVSDQTSVSVLVDGISKKSGESDLILYQKSRGERWFIL